MTIHTSRVTGEPLPKVIPLDMWAKDFEAEADRLEAESRLLAGTAMVYRKIAKGLRGKARAQTLT